MEVEWRRYPGGLIHAFPCWPDWPPRWSSLCGAVGYMSTTKLLPDQERKGSGWSRECRRCKASLDRMRREEALS